MFDLCSYFTHIQSDEKDYKIKEVSSGKALSLETEETTDKS